MGSSPSICSGWQAGRVARGGERRTGDRVWVCSLNRKNYDASSRSGASAVECAFPLSTPVALIGCPPAQALSVHEGVYTRPASSTTDLSSALPHQKLHFRSLHKTRTKPTTPASRQRVLSHSLQRGVTGRTSATAGRHWRSHPAGSNTCRVTDGGRRARATNVQDISARFANPREHAGVLQRRRCPGRDLLDCDSGQQYPQMRPVEPLPGGNPMLLAVWPVRRRRILPGRM